MPNWSPKLETLIRDFATYEENNTKDGCNPRISLTMTVLRIAFRSATQGQPLFKKICSEMEITPDYQSGYTATLKRIIDLAESNGSNASDKLKKKLAFTQELNQRLPDTGVIERIKASKRGEIRYPT